MSCDTYSKLYSSVYLSIGQPEDDLLSRLELAEIITQSLELRLESVRQAEQGIQIAKTAEFTLGNEENEKNLTTLAADFVAPMWIERQVYNLLSKPVWQFVPTVNIAQLQQFRNEASPAVAFYGANSKEVIAQFSYYGQDVWQWYRIHRCWYLPTLTFPDSDTTEIELPDNLVTMVKHDAIVGALPLMIVNASKQLHIRPELQNSINGWSVMLGQRQIAQAKFEEYFEKWRRESRGSHRPRRRRDVLRAQGAFQKTTMFGGGV